ncbi:gliotoxin biosynthesis protein GliK [Amylocarpus encephaloides]|uniref:gamma-glutamylcyclotransferase n=1 Tax=Amylocarpus encephaloides TaxID=45428 RepID=A0A9P7YBY9_9HELO|nr:gliotoxin biosynthesis protein GliK [Amylocarpus encephaloides]
MPGCNKSARSGSQRAPKSTKELVWYLAYGSNMSTGKFTGSRGIVPLAAARVRAPGRILAFNIPGLPYSEPTFTSIAPREPALLTRPEKKPSPDLLGVAYLITERQYVQVRASEGGGIAYDDIEVDAVPVDAEDAKVTGPNIRARTLAAAIERNPWPRASERYMSIIIAGAIEVRMPQYYQDYLECMPVYQPPQDTRGKCGAAIFLAFWGPVMNCMERITKKSIGPDGCAPMAVILLVRWVLVAIWLTHDMVFAPFFGRGDGCGRAEGQVARDFDGWV